MLYGEYVSAFKLKKNILSNSLWRRLSAKTMKKDIHEHTYIIIFKFPVA